MPSTEATDKFFGAISSAHEALLDAVKAGNERGYRVSKSLLDGIQKEQRQVLELSRRVAKSPRDLGGLYGSVVESLTATQGRALELTRQWLDEAADSRHEVRESLRRLVDANRTASQAAVEVARGTFGRAAGAVRQARGGGNSRKAETPQETPRRSPRGGSKSQG